MARETFTAEKGALLMARTNLMQDTLIPGFSFGEPVTVSDAVKISGQRAQVEAIMAAGYWQTIPGLRQELKRRFGTLYAETSISARLRGLRHMGYKVESRRTRPGSGLYEYRAVKCAVLNVIVHDFPLTNGQRFGNDGARSLGLDPNAEATA